MAELNWTERLRRKLIHKLGGVLMDEVQPCPVAAAESYTTEELTCRYWKFAGGQENERLKMDNLTLVGVLCMAVVAADIAFLVAGSACLRREEKR